MIVNYVRGVRGNADPNCKERRDAARVHLIQALGGHDDPDNYTGKQRGGQVTDAWDWESMDNQTNYHVRRCKP